MPEAIGAQARRHRRALLRAHHPDTGGDPAEFARQVLLLDRAERTREAAPPDRPGRAGAEVVFVRRPRGVRALTAWFGNRRPRTQPRVR